MGKRHRFNTGTDRKRAWERARRQHELAKRRLSVERALRPLVDDSPDGYLVCKYRGSDRVTQTTTTIGGNQYVITGTYLSLSGSFWNLEPPPCRIYRDGFAESVDENSRRRPKIRPWRDLNKRELDVIQSFEWEVSESKHPLEYLGEVLDDDGQ